MLYYTSSTEISLFILLYHLKFIRKRKFLNRLSSIIHFFRQYEFHNFFNAKRKQELPLKN